MHELYKGVLVDSYLPCFLGFMGLGLFMVTGVGRGGRESLAFLWEVDTKWARCYPAHSRARLACPWTVEKSGERRFFSHQ